MSEFRRSEQFSAAVDLLLQMQAIEALRGGWVVFDLTLDTTTADWCRTEEDAIFAPTGATKAQVPTDDSRNLAIANLTGGMVFSIEEARHMATAVPGAAPKYVEAAEQLEAHLFGGHLSVVAS